MATKYLQPLLYGALIPLLAMSRYLVSIEADPDLWWHLRIGLEMLELGGIPAIDTYSFGVLQPRWINHEWLSEFLFAAAFQAWGEGGLLLLRAVLLIGSALCLLRLFFWIWPRPFIVLLVWLSLLPFLHLLMNVRPHSFTYLLVPLFLCIIERYRRGIRSSIWWLPPLMLLWVNLHGGFLFGMLIVGAFVIERWLQADSSALRRSLLALAALTGAAAFVSPYGYELFPYLVRELGGDHGGISEWQRPPWKVQLFLLLFVVPSILLLLRVRRMPRLAHVVLFVVSALCAFRHTRFVLLLAMMNATILLETIALLWRQSASERIERFVGALERPIVLGVIALIVTLTSLFTIRTGLRESGAHVYFDSRAYPTGAVQFLAEHCELRGNLAAPFYWGGYAMWHLAPRFRVGVDGRNVTLYDEEYFERVRLGYEMGDLTMFLAGRGADFILLERSEPRLLAALAASGEWRPLFRDEVAVLFARNLAEHVTPHEAATPSQSLPFPGPPFPQNGGAEGFRISFKSCRQN